MDLLINADARQIPLADCSVNCIVTSPPYYGLRDYGTARWEGGDQECEHNPQRPDGGDRSDRTLPLGRGGVYRDVCGKCGAIRIDEQIGLEQTPDEYIANLVAVFRECKRILRDDGTLWVNIGDSYAGNGAKTTGRNDAGRNNVNGFAGSNGYDDAGGRISSGFTPGLKPKDLIGIPWMLAFALRADGWWLRQDLIWAKSNPMPESVKDRCTKAHEYIFLLSKSSKYYYDYKAIAEPLTESAIERCKHYNAENKLNPNLKMNKHKYPISLESQNNAYDKVNSIIARGEIPMRNKRSVWTVATRSYRGAHFATYPPKLIEPCILAGCPKGGIVFDPFVGSGTTVAVANSLGRMGIGIDLNYNYLLLARKRIERVQLPLLLV